MPRGGARNFLNKEHKALKHSRVKACLAIGLSIRQAASLLSLHGRGYSIYFVHQAYKLLSFKTKPVAVKKVGVFDNDLQGYMKFFLMKKLHAKFNVNDLIQDCCLAIATQGNLRRQLLKFLQKNTMPKGKDLSLLKAVLYRQRLKFIEKETRHPMSRLNFDVCDIHNSPMEDYDDHRR